MFKPIFQMFCIILQIQALLKLQATSADLIDEAAIHAKIPDSKLSRDPIEIINTDESGDFIIVSDENRALRISKSNSQDTNTNNIKRVIQIFDRYRKPESDFNAVINSIQKTITDEFDLLSNGNVSFDLIFTDQYNKDHFIIDDSHGVPFFSSDIGLASSLGVPFPGLLSYSSSDRIIYRFEDINMGLRIARAPLFAPMDDNNQKLHLNTGLPVFYFFLTNEDFRNVKKLNEYRKVCVEFRNEVRIGYLPFTENKNLRRFGILETELPAIITRVEMTKYSRGFIHTAKDLTMFLNDFKENKLEPFLVITEIDDNTFEDGILQVNRRIYNGQIDTPQNDVLIVFGSPECGLCYKLLPEIVKLAEDIKDVIFAYMDMRHNDLPELIIKGYPTILFISKGNSIRSYYDGHIRTAANIEKFIKKMQRKVLKKESGLDYEIDSEESDKDKKDERVLDPNGQDDSGDEDVDSGIEYDSDVDAKADL